MSVSYNLIEENVCIIRMDDGKRNALGTDMFIAMSKALDQAEKDSATVILVGNEHIFSAGFNLTELSKSREKALMLMDMGSALCVRLLEFKTPIIACCSGSAYPMGAFLLCSSDIRIGIDSPDVKIGYIEIRAKMSVPNWALEVGRGRLTNAGLNLTATTGIMFDSYQAKEAGFLDTVVPASELMNTAFAVAEDFKSIGLAEHHITKKRLRKTWIERINLAREELITS